MSISTPYSLTPASSGRASETPARAYCGAAHRYTWVITAGEPVPEEVGFSDGVRTHHYRLVHAPRTGLPARDHLGHLLYVAGRYGEPASATESMRPTPATRHEFREVA